MLLSDQKKPAARSSLESFIKLTHYLVFEKDLSIEMFEIILGSG